MPPTKKFKLIPFPGAYARRVGEVNVPKAATTAKVNVPKAASRKRRTTGRSVDSQQPSEAPLNVPPITTCRRLYHAKWVVPRPDVKQAYLQLNGGGLEPWVEVRRSKNLKSGLGLFALRNFQKGECLGRYNGVFYGPYGTQEKADRSWLRYWLQQNEYRHLLYSKRNKVHSRSVNDDEAFNFDDFESPDFLSTFYLQPRPEGKPQQPSERYKWYIVDGADAGPPFLQYINDGGGAGNNNAKFEDTGSGNVLTTKDIENGEEIHLSYITGQKNPKGFGFGDDDDLPLSEYFNLPLTTRRPSPPASDPGDDVPLTTLFTTTLGSGKRR